MIGYIFFHVFLILLVGSVVITAEDLVHGNYETIGPILFLLALIGLACNFAPFFRVFSGMYGIVWSG